VPRKRVHALYVGGVLILVLMLDVFRVPLLGSRKSARIGTTFP
jgi:signal peptidase I